MTPREQQMERALEEALSTLELMEPVPLADPQYQDRVFALGCEIGFGALMASASRGWADNIALRGYPADGQHVSGPSRHIILTTIAKIRAALSTPAAPSGEYARGIEAALDLIESDKERCCLVCGCHRDYGLWKHRPDCVVPAIRALAQAPREDARLALASALDRALTCWRDPEMRASAHFDAAMDELARLSPPADQGETR